MQLSGTVRAASEPTELEETTSGAEVISIPIDLYTFALAALLMKCHPGTRVLIKPKPRTGTING